MTAEQLIGEGRRLMRPTVLLTPAGTGDPAALWFTGGTELSEIERRWLSVDARLIPGCDVRGWLTIVTDEESCEGGHVAIEAQPPVGEHTVLFARPIDLLPPIDAVFALGSPAIDLWLREQGWQRDWGYNANFKGRDIVGDYERAWGRGHPLQDAEAYATLGGWHMQWPDNDWHDLLSSRLLVTTFRDSEPWVEAWQMPDGELRVIQRIT